MIAKPFLVVLDLQYLCSSILGEKMKVFKDAINGPFADHLAVKGGPCFRTSSTAFYGYFVSLSFFKKTYWQDVGEYNRHERSE